LGADLPAARTSGSTTVAEEAPRAAPGADTELLESGITPADILAHAQDYGRWALGNAAQLHQLLDLQEGK
ncbi:lysis protein, partial [Pseudomonas aeruginosa]